VLTRHRAIPWLAPCPRSTNSSSVKILSVDSVRKLNTESADEQFWDRAALVNCAKVREAARVMVGRSGASLPDSNPSGELGAETMRADLASGTCPPRLLTEEPGATPRRRASGRACRPTRRGGCCGSRGAGGRTGRGRWRGCRRHVGPNENRPTRATQGRKVETSRSARSGDN
jgi:hypothetical protein